MVSYNVSKDQIRPLLICDQGTVVTRHNYNQPTPNEFEIQKSILVAANARWGALPLLIFEGDQKSDIRSVKGLLEIVDTHVTQLNSVNVSTLIHRLASITQNHEQSQKALTRDHRMKKVLRRAVEVSTVWADPTVVIALIINSWRGFRAASHCPTYPGRLVSCS